MKKICSFLKHEPVFAVSLLAAVVSCFFVPPDAAYAAYVDFRTLALLYALMVVVAGLRTAGVFTSLAQTLCGRAKSTRVIGVMLVCLCFFSSMLITNDVALLTFVLFAVIVLGMAGRKSDLIRVVVLQTVAANLDSMLTPVGNPQNLYLHSYYEMSMGEFFSATFPVWGLSLVLLLSGFTSNAKALLLGVNIGGLGTPIASLASLISLKLYTGTEDARLGRFLLEFTVVNVLLLIVLSAFQLLL